MRRAYFLVVVFLGTSIQVWGQTWGTCSNGASGSTGCLDGTSVGIGTTTPYYGLDLEGGTASTGDHAIAWIGRSYYDETGIILGYHANGTIADYPIVRGGGYQALGLALAGDSLNQAEMFIQSGGNVGIGTTTPNAKFSIGNNVYTAPLGSSYAQYQMLLYDSGSPSSSYGLGIEAGNIGFNSNGGYKFYQSGGSTPLMVIGVAGSGGSPNVGIGTANPQHLLHVAGTIGAESIIVSSTGADYVFAPNYHLKPLSEVAHYVKENHHLPDIPSAAEMKESGVNLGDMQTKLLAKVEELTLHLIQEDARNDKLEQENLQLQERISRLESLTIPAPVR